LIWAHTYGERFVPAGMQRGQIATGAARCICGIPTTPEGYPETVLWASDCLHIGGGQLSPVSKGVWEFSVSGFAVVESWVKSRLRNRSGRRSSSLDNIRPLTWSADMTEELLKLLWIVEATVGIQPELDSILSEILTAPLFVTTDLPQPTSAERTAPGLETESEDELPFEDLDS